MYGKGQPLKTRKAIKLNQTDGVKEPISVVLATPTLLTGGAEKFVAELAVRFDPAKFRITVLVTRGQVQQSQLEELHNAGIEVKTIGGRSRTQSILQSALELVRLKPKVVHTNIGSLLHVSLGVLFLPKSTVRLHTLHSMAGHAEPGVRLGASKRLMRLLKFTPVSISRAVRESASSAFEIPESNIPLVPNGVDFGRFAQAPEGQQRASDTTRFVAVGSLLPVKQHGDLITAFSKMQPDLHAKSRLTIVGGGPLHEQLEQQIDDLGLSKYVTLLGNRADVPDILKTQHVFVSASRTEGFPLSLLEGLAAGLPAAVTAVDGVNDIVRDGVEGILVPPGDIKVMTEAMERMAVDHSLQERLSEQASQRAAAFSWERCIESYSALYTGSGCER